MQTVSATCEAGEIQGRVKEEAFLFAGIPYAQPPVGNLRLRRATVKALFEPFPALKFGAAAPKSCMAA